MLEAKILQSSNMAGDCKDFLQCSLDNNCCLKLSSILHAFNAAISEEQAWAVCFQTAKCMMNEWNSDSSSCYCLSDTAHVLIHKDGFIHRSTVKLCSKGKHLIYNRTQSLCLYEIILRILTTCWHRSRSPSTRADGFWQPESRPARVGNKHLFDRRIAGGCVFLMLNIQNASAVIFQFGLRKI